jgi:hypothetical protein
VQSKRQGLYKSIYFMSQLPDSEEEDGAGQEGEEVADYDTQSKKRKLDQQHQMVPQQYQMMQQQQQMVQQQAASMSAVVAHSSRGGRGGRLKQTARKGNTAPMMQNRNLFNSGKPVNHSGMSTRQSKAGHRSDHAEYDLESDGDKPKSSMETKQFLLHLLSTEILVNTRLYGEFTCVHSEFDSWSPSLPHSTILSVLSFFGVSSKWLTFFTNFLQMPLKFLEDGASAETRIRRRGVPGAHTLSAVCGEVVLFCLDFAVNQYTDGAQLYRMHDDFWIWYVPQPVHDPRNYKTHHTCLTMLKGPPIIKRSLMAGTRLHVLKI